MNVIATRNQVTGGVSIHQPVGKVQEIVQEERTVQQGDGKTVSKLVPRLKDVDTTTDHVIARLGLQGSPLVVLEASALPDPYFRNAWEFHETKGAVINVPKAQEIQRGHWRRLRAPMLKALDEAFLRAQEDGDPAKISAIAAKKRALRDVTASPLPDDPDGIKSTVPAILTS